MAKKKDIEAVNSVETKKKPLTEKAADKIEKVAEWKK